MSAAPAAAEQVLQAQRLSAKAQRQSEDGQLDAALASEAAALRIRRTLAAADPRRFLAHVGVSLNTMAGWQSQLGRQREALATQHEAVDAYRRVVGTNTTDTTSSTSLLDLAKALDNEGTLQRELGPAALAAPAALATAQETVDVYRRLAHVAPGTPASEAHRYQLVTSLNHLYDRQSERAQREAALASAQEATTVARTLVLGRPGPVYLHDLALSVSNLGVAQNALGHREAALTCATEATEIYRTLARDQPAVYLANLAGSLSNLGNRRFALGHREAALKAGQESVTICRKLAAADPDEFLPDLARCLNNVGNCHSALGDPRAALVSSQEALGLYRRLAASPAARTVPGAYVPDLAASLNNVGSIQHQLDLLEPALASAKESVALRRQLARARPDVYTPDLARSLFNLGNMHSALGHHEAALAATQESTDLRRTLAAARPDVFLPDLAAGLGSMATLHSKLGHHAAVRTSATEALRLYRQLVAQRPAVFTPEMAVPLLRLGEAMFQLGDGDPAAAVAAFREAIEILEPLAEDLPAVYLGTYRGAVRDLADRLHRLPPTSPTARASAELVVRHLPAVADDSDDSGPRFAAGLAYLAACQAAVGQLDAAAVTRGLAIEMLFEQDY